MTPAEKIIDARKRQALTQEELADRSGVTLRTIQRIEKAQTVPRGYTRKAIAQALNIPLEELVTPHTGEPLEVNGPDVLEQPDQTFLPQLISLSALAGLVIPFANIIVPLILWNKNKTNKNVYTIGKSIITTQILWTAATAVVLLLITLTQILLAKYTNIIPGPWIIAAAIGMKIINVAIIIHTTRRIQPLRYTPHV